MAQLQWEEPIQKLKNPEEIIEIFQIYCSEEFLVPILRWPKYNTVLYNIFEEKWWLNLPTSHFVGDRLSKIQRGYPLKNFGKKWMLFFKV